MLNSADFYKQQMTTGKYENYIETSTGQRFYIDHPEFNIVDIAGALSKQCRFMGHTKTFYSVAEHCVLTGSIMSYFNLGDPFEGLMHDAHEAYCVDMAAPWKAELPTYKAFESRFEFPLRKAFGLTEKISEGCKKADWIALFVEAFFLMPSKAKDWITPDSSIREMADKYVDQLGFVQIGWAPAVAEAVFLEEFNSANVQK